MIANNQKCNRDIQAGRANTTSARSVTATTVVTKTTPLIRFLGTLPLFSLPFPPLPCPVLILQSSTFFVVATLKMRGENTPLEETLSEVAWVAGSVYTLRFVLDLWLRAPLHWGTLIDVEDLPFGWREGFSRLRGALFGRRSPTATTMPAEPPPLATTPQATPLSPKRAEF